jgi:hypothetical protein
LQAGYVHVQINIFIERGAALGLVFEVRLKTSMRLRLAGEARLLYKPSSITPAKI